MGNSGVWLAIGVVMAVIGLAFTIIFSSISENQIELLVDSCVNSGGEAIVEKKGFIMTTSYQFECKK